MTPETAGVLILLLVVLCAEVKVYRRQANLQRHMQGQIRKEATLR